MQSKQSSCPVVWRKDRILHNSSFKVAQLRPFSSCCGICTECYCFFHFRRMSAKNAIFPQADRTRSSRALEGRYLSFLERKVWTILFEMRGAFLAGKLIYNSVQLLKERVLCHGLAKKWEMQIFFSGGHYLPHTLCILLLESVIHSSH